MMQNNKQIGGDIILSFEEWLEFDESHRIEYKIEYESNNIEDKQARYIDYLDYMENAE